jgi:hypothetical protein
VKPCSTGGDAAGAGDSHDRRRKLRDLFPLSGRSVVKALLGLLPPWLPIAAAAVLLLALVGGFFALKAAWKAEAAAQVIAADQKAVIEQKERDAALSAAIIVEQQEKLAALAAQASAIVRRIDNAPKTTQCGPVMRDASRGLHELFDRTGAGPAGRQPAAAVPDPGTGR